MDRETWDKVVAAGWGPAFAAGRVLEFATTHANNKLETDPLNEARWYYARLIDMFHGNHKPLDKVMASLNNYNNRTLDRVAAEMLEARKVWDTLDAMLPHEVKLLLRPTSGELPRRASQ